MLAQSTIYEDTSSEHHGDERDWPIPGWRVQIEARKRGIYVFPHSQTQCRENLPYLRDDVTGSVVDLTAMYVCMYVQVWTGGEENKCVW